jgi:hypothetical protein
MRFATRAPLVLTTMLGSRWRRQQIFFAPKLHKQHAQSILNYSQSMLGTPHAIPSLALPLFVKARADGIHDLLTSPSFEALPLLPERAPPSTALLYPNLESALR